MSDASRGTWSTRSRVGVGPLQFGKPATVGAASPSDRELAILRYLRDHGVATVSTVAHEVFAAPRTTFGRILRRRPAGDALSGLVSAGLVAREGEGDQAAFSLTQAGRQALRNASLGPPFTDG